MEEITVELTNNFSQFLNDSTLSDCTLIIHNNDEVTEVKSHSIILANSSKYFYNLFTSGMKEQETRCIDLTLNPENLLPVVIDFMYTGKIEKISKEKIIPLLEIARFYDIPILFNVLKNKVISISSKDPATILEFYNQSVEECEGVSSILVKCITSHFSKYTIPQLSECLLVTHFCQILSDRSKSIKIDQVINELKEFLGDYQMNQSEEKEAVKNLLLNIPGGMKYIKDFIL